MKKNIAESL